MTLVGTVAGFVQLPGLAGLGQVPVLVTGPSPRTSKMRRVVWLWGNHLPPLPKWKDRFWDIFSRPL